MGRTEHVQYTMTEELVDEVASLVIPEFVPRPWPAKLWGALYAMLGASVLLSLLLYGILEMEDAADDLVMLCLAGLIACAILPGLMLCSLVMNWGVRRWVLFCRNVLRGRLKRAYREIMDTTIRWSFHEDGFDTESLTTRRSIGWSDLKSIRLLPGQRYFAVKNGPELMFPENSLSDRIKDLITQKAKEYRIDIQDKSKVS